MGSPSHGLSAPSVWDGRATCPVPGTTPLQAQPYSCPTSCPRELPVAAGAGNTTGAAQCPPPAGWLLGTQRAAAVAWGSGQLGEGLAQGPPSPGRPGIAQPSVSPALHFCFSLAFESPRRQPLVWDVNGLSTLSFPGEDEPPPEVQGRGEDVCSASYSVRQPKGGTQEREICLYPHRHNCPH